MYNDWFFTCIKLKYLLKHENHVIESSKSPPKKITRGERCFNFQPKGKSTKNDPVGEKIPNCEFYGFLKIPFFALTTIREHVFSSVKQYGPIELKWA